MPYITATCHTPGCGNAGVACDINYSTEHGTPPAVCGVCGQSIDDVTDNPDQDAP